MIEIKFSKSNSNVFQIETNEKLGPYVRINLKQEGFKNLENTLIWQKISEDNEIVENVFQIFTENKYKIIPDQKINEILQQLKEIKEEFEKFTQIGIEIKKDKNPDLPNIELAKNSKGEKYSVKPFQKMPINHMITVPNTANFSIPGSGKTLMTLSSFNILKNQNKIDQMWVIGPIASFKAWETDYEKLFDKSISKNTLRYKGSVDERKRLTSQIKDKDIIIISYGTASNDIELIKKIWKNNDKKILLVLDESHHIKSFEETTIEGNETISSKMIRLGKHANRRCILTGTPIPRDLEDLWSQITFLWPHNEPFKELGDGTGKGFQKYIKNEFGVEEEIKDIMDFMWSRVTNKEMAPEMPDRHPWPIQVQMDSTQQQIYHIIKHQAVTEMDEGRSREAVRKLKKALIIRLYQTVTNPRLISENDRDFQINGIKTPQKKGDQDILNLLSQYDGGKTTPKIMEVAKHARELSTGIGKRALDNKPKNVLIFTIFKGTADDIAKELKDLEPLVVKGDIDGIERESRYEEFKNWDFSNGCGKILIATVGAVAESVSLHKNKNDEPVCQNVIYAERSHNAGQYMQSLFRVYRVGSKKELDINYYYYKSEFDGGITSIDDTIDGILKDRTDRMFDILGDEFIMKPISLGMDKEEDGKEYNENDKLNDIEDVDELEDEIFKNEITKEDSN